MSEVELVSRWYIHGEFGPHPIRLIHYKGAPIDPHGGVAACGVRVLSYPNTMGTADPSLVGCPKCIEYLDYINSRKVPAMRRLTESDVIFKLYCMPEDLVSIRGNVMASGDDETDRESESWVLSQLESGNEWAWCIVKVCAVYDDDLQGESNYLGACSYESEKEFRESDYFSDLCQEALFDLNEKIHKAAKLIAEE